MGSLCTEIGVTSGLIVESLPIFYGDINPRLVQSLRLVFGNSNADSHNLSNFLRAFSAIFFSKLFVNWYI